MQAPSNLTETIDVYRPTWLIVTLEKLSEANKTNSAEKTTPVNVIELARDGQIAVVKRATGTEEKQENLTLNELCAILESA